ncbi:MAG TPA: aldo/keto reductase [Candidatus Acidoferrales bacterium]|nr:aldo/keto reductase [Candidatus Acidoferrales bacterium]
MPSFATPEGTARYAKRFAGRAAEGHFRGRNGLLLSSIGIGTYLGEHDAATDAAYTDAIVAAVSSGVNVIDTAINYRFQRSERSIGAALQRLAAAGISREEIFLCTKGGFLTPDGEMPADPRAYFTSEYVNSGILRPEEVAAGGHCLAPRFLENQLQRSLKNLGVDCVDVYYVHNPETQLATVARNEFLSRLRAAFEYLESAVNACFIRVYGAATWNGFRQPPDSSDYLSVEEMVSMARDIAGENHHFRFVQLPVNLAMTEAIGRPNQILNGEYVPMVEAARENGVSLIASASLLQVQVAQNLPPFVSNVLGLESGVLCALQFARSAPGITTALVGMSRREHVKFNLQLLEVPPTPIEQFIKLFEKSEEVGE